MFLELFFKQKRLNCNGQLTKGTAVNKKQIQDTIYSRPKNIYACLHNKIYQHSGFCWSHLLFFCMFQHILPLRPRQTASHTDAIQAALQGWWEFSSGALRDDSVYLERHHYWNERRPVGGAVSTADHFRNHTLVCFRLSGAIKEQSLLLSREKKINHCSEWNAARRVAWVMSHIYM